WRQTTFFPFAVTARLARAGARVVALELDAPTYATTAHGAVPLVDAVAVADDDGISVFLVNRSPDLPVDVRVEIGAAVTAIDEATSLWDDDPRAVNDLADSTRVGLRPLDAELGDGVLSATLPPVSWSAIRLAR